MKLKQSELVEMLDFAIEDETELCAFFVAIAALSLFIRCLFFLEGEKKIEGESNGVKEMHVVQFHRYRAFLIKL